MSIFWNKNFVKDFTLKRSQTVSTVFWKNNTNEILEQICNSITNNSEIILTDILPDELPYDLPSSDYNYFVNKFQYCPPQISLINKSDSNEKNIKLIIFDENHEGIFAKPHLRTLFIESITVSKGYTVKKFEYNSNSLQGINELITKASELILISECPTLIDYIVQASIIFNFKPNIYPEVKNSIRLNGLGLSIKNDNIELQKRSIRSSFDFLFNEETIIEVHSEPTIRLLVELKTAESFENLNKDLYVNLYFQRLHKINIKNYLWQKALPIEFLKNRFSRRLLHCLLSTRSKNDQNLLNISIKTILNQFLLNLANNYSYCFDEVENEIIYLISNYYKDHIDIFDLLFDDIKSKVNNSENAIHSIIGECFLVICFQHSVDTEDKNLYLSKARYYLSKDIVNGCPKYTHYKSYIRMIELIRSDEGSSQVDLPYKLLPYVKKNEELTSTFKSNKSPCKDDTIWFFKNILRSNGFFNYYLKHNLFILKTQKLLCDFFANNANSECAKIINLAINNSILDSYHNNRIDFNTKIISLFYYKSLNNTSIDDFLTDKISFNNLKNDSELMLLSLASKDFLSSRESIIIDNDLLGMNFITMLKPSNDVFNFCLYTLAKLINHADLITLLRISESKNPLHFYLESQFE